MSTVKNCSIEIWRRIAQPVLAGLIVEPTEVVIKSSKIYNGSEVIHGVQFVTTKDKVAEAIELLKNRVLHRAPQIRSARVYIFTTQKIIIEFDLFEASLPVLQNMAAAMLTASYSMTSFFD